MRAVVLAVGVLLAGVAEAGQWLDADLPEIPSCPIGDFRAKLTALDAACCTDDGACAAGAVLPSACSPACGGKFVPLYAKCNRTMTQLLDGMDGITDGVADSVESLRRACLALPAYVIVDEMIRMRDEDGCTIEGDGVGEQGVQQVDTSGCVDGELASNHTASGSPWIPGTFSNLSLRPAV